MSQLINTQKWRIPALGKKMATRKDSLYVPVIIAYTFSYDWIGFFPRSSFSCGDFDTPEATNPNCCFFIHLSRKEDKLDLYADADGNDVH